MMSNTPSGHWSALCSATASSPCGAHFHQFELVNEFVALVLPLTAERIWVRPLLDFASGKGIRHVSPTSRDLRLMNVGAL
jgi:hypothetical protein